MKLNLPPYDFKIRVNSSGKDEIFDEFRGKYIMLSAEEWVRQNFIRYLKEVKGYPPMLIAIEKGIKVNTLQKRFDAVVYKRDGQPVVLIEFKSPDVKINQKVMEQISGYNLKLKVSYLIVSNGLTHYCCHVDYKTTKISFLKEIPEYKELKFSE